MPEDMPDRMPEDLPDRMPEDMPEHLPEDMPGRMPEAMPDRMPEDLPVTKCINVMVGITRSKVIVSSSYWLDVSFFILTNVYIYNVLLDGYQPCILLLGRSGVVCPWFH
jgi:hypothetical protein